MSNMIKVPLLRFPGFDDEWEEESMENLVKETSKKYKSANATMNLLSLSIEDGIVPHSQTGLRDNSSKNKDNYKIVHENNLVYNKMRMWQGSSDISQYEGIVSPAYVVCELNEKTYPIYFKYYLKRYKSIFLFWKYSQGLTKDKLSLPYSVFKSIKIFLPSLEEQSKIGSFFKTLDSLIETQEKYIEKMENEKKGLLQDIFSRDIRLFDENGERFKGEWREVKLGEVSERKSSKRIINKSRDNKNKEYCYPLFNASGIVGYTKDFDVSKSIAVCKDGTIGEVFFINNKASVVATIDYILNKDDVDLYFLYLTIKRIDFRVYSVGTSIKHIYYSDYKNHKISLPSLEEQKAIGKFFKIIDRKIEKEKELLEKYKEMKKGLLQDMFI